MKIFEWSKYSVGMKILIITLIVLLVSVIGVIAYEIIKDNSNGFIINNSGEGDSSLVVDTTKKEISIFSGNKRSVAVMIDNNTNAWPHSSINKAYMVYEIIVEAGETRVMALFRNVDVDIVGPIRSSRHYFLDYALENDAIYTHLGWSPQAQSDISSLGVNNINGQFYETGKARTENASFWRSSAKSAPHNAYANLDKIYEIAESKGYRTTSDKESVLNYVTEEVELTAGTVANTVTIPYTNSNVIKYEYNAQTKRYTKYSKGKKQTDEQTGEDVTTKNIIITFAKNYTLADKEKKGRQGLDNIGTLDGYYITNGKAIKITCQKESRTAQTVYKDMDGNEIKVNDGNTFVQICPINANVTIQ